jgi:hypothetical protein
VSQTIIMSLQFVKSAVLSSEDGIDFSKEEVLDTEEAQRARVAADLASRRSLFDQLAEQSDKKQAQYDANTKLIYAPPKALDEEEFSFLQDVEDERQRAQRSKADDERRALDEFRAKKLENSM